MREALILKAAPMKPKPPTSAMTSLLGTCFFYKRCHFLSRVFHINHLFYSIFSLQWIQNDNCLEKMMNSLVGHFCYTSVLSLLFPQPKSKKSCCSFPSFEAHARVFHQVPRRPKAKETTFVGSRKQTKIWHLQILPNCGHPSEKEVDKCEK